ncbi:Transcription factor [Penicillium concentricum]|uniref:Transcription factor n=1 Tax=Penicillium concentricum TaxID=293559 RepID=A0A9W9UW73_9EURO|nr:Transcription factor [Penicillium concentricum]KAJ5359813.1 Transcription factor [Penicillium concentricum]
MMPLSEPRHIKKPRLSLSCIVCRRRKVRCGREQPQCANCVRMKENCVYRAMVRDESTGRVRPVSPQDRDARDSDARLDLPWPHWGPDANAPYPEKPSRPPSRPQLSNASPSPHRQLYPTVPSWEEAIQLPHFRDASVPQIRGSSTTTRDPSPVPSTSSFPTLRDPLCRDYLSIRRGGRVRYVGRTFWGLVAGKENLSDDFFDENRHAHPDLPLPHISSIGMFNLLRSLPTKPVSDALFEIFFLAVWPLVPLLHPPSLQAEYDEFWDWCRNSESALPSDKLRDDPTFICLLFAVLYCGASAAPVASWTYTNLHGLQKETTVSHLKSAFTTSLSLCQHLEHPTFNTLVSTLLTGPFLDRPFEPMRSLVHVSTTVRIAQIMGLHREGTWSGMSCVDKEIRRRIWWHIVWLDVQSSISTGLTPCCGNEALETVSMVDTHHEEPSDIPARLSQRTDSVTKTNGKSVAALYAIGRFQTAHLKAKIVAHLQSAQGPTQDGFGELVTDAKGLLQKIDSIIARVPTQGIPERGYIPSRLANASPSTHPSLYKDDAKQPTVFAAWTRIMLTLLKSEVAILLQKPFLLPPDRKNAMTQLCVNYLRIYLQLYQAPAFSPYAWFFCSHYGPLQCVFITLIYLHSFPDSGETLLARYCVDEVIHHCVAQYQTPNGCSTRTSPDDTDSNASKARMPLVIQVLVDLHERLDSSLEAEDRPPLPLDLIGCQARFPTSHLATKSSELRATSIHTSPDGSSSTTRTNRNCETPSMTTGPLPVVAGEKPGPPNSLLVAGSDSGLDMDFLATISDLEAWSSSLILESDNLLAHSDNITPDHAIITGLGAHSIATGRRDLHEGFDFQA